MKRFTLALFLLLATQAQAANPPNCPTAGGTQALNFTTSNNAYSCNPLAVTTSASSALGTTTTTNPYRTGELSTGFFTSGSGQIGVEALGTTAMSWTSTGINIPGSLTMPSLNSYSLMGTTSSGGVENFHLGTNLFFSTTGGITSVNATGGGGGSTPTGPAGGDLGSTYPNPTVLNIKNAIPGLVPYQFLSATTSTAFAWANAGNLIDPRTYGAVCPGPGYTGGLSSSNQGILITNAGSSYTTGTYTTVALTGGTGTGAQATIVVAGGVVTTVTITTAGSGYTLRDQVSAAAADIGGTGSGFTAQVAHFSANRTPVYDSVHDSTTAFETAFAVAQNTGQAVMVPDGCWVAPTANSLDIPQGVVMVGEGFSPSYSYNFSGGTTDAMPVLYIIGHPVYGIKFGKSPNNAFIGFQVDASADGSAFSTTNCIGTSTNGVGGDSSVWMHFMATRQCLHGIGSSDDSATYFLHSDHSDYGANAYGIYGHAADLDSSNDTFESMNNDGIKLTGFGGQARINEDRFEFLPTGINLSQYGGIEINNTQFDHVSQTGVRVGSTSGDIFISNSSFQASGVSSSDTCSPSVGNEAHITLSKTTTGGANLHLSNTNFTTGGLCGPKYAIEATTTGSYNDYIEVSGGSSLSGTSSGYTTDFFNFANGRPEHIQVDIQGQATQGKVANGLFKSQASGLPSAQWTGLTAVGDITSLNNQIVPATQAYQYLVAGAFGTGPTTYAINSFSDDWDCDVVQQNIFPNVNPGASNNPVVTWQSSIGDPSYGAGFFSGHRTDTNSCRLAGLTWMSIPTTSKVYGQNATACVATGTWTADSSYGGTYGITSSTNADSLACSLTTNGGPLYLWYQMRGNNGGTFTYNLDGGTNTTVLTQGQNSFTFPVTTASRSVGAVRIPNSTAGTHTVNIAVSSTTSSTQTVTIEGLGTTPNNAFIGTQPTVYYGNQIPDTTYPDASAAFTSDQLRQTSQLFADGLPVNHVDVQKYLNASTDYGVNGFTGLNATGQTHIADAFIATMQGKRSSMNAVNPLDYGASCNSHYFAASYTTAGHDFPVTTVAGSADISVLRYKFQPGVATARGGGDVGKRFCIGPGAGFTGSPGPCTYIASVNTTTNKATLGITMATSSTSAYGVMGGYPTNPNDPSTAKDDTIPIQLAGAAAKLSGGRVFLPTNCMVHNLTMPQDIELVGNGPGDFYLEGGMGDDEAHNQATILNCGITGFSDDSPQCIQQVPHVRYSNFMMRAPTFPYTLFGISAACLGYSTDSKSGPGAQILTDHLSFFGCPVDIGQAYGYNYDVNFTASIADNGNGTSTMTVTNISSTNFRTADGWTVQDFLALGRTVSGPGVTAGTTITAAPPMGYNSGTGANNGTGVFTVNKALTVSSTSLVSPRVGQGMEIRDEFSQHTVGGIGYNGDFTDSMVTGSVCTGTFMAECVRMGPNVVNYGNGSFRWLGGRMEEMQGSTSPAGRGAAITCDGCGLDIVGLDMQFNGAYNIRTLGSGSTVSFTGGHMYAGGHLSGYQNAMISLGGTSPRVSVDGVALTTNDVVNGGTTTYLFATATGATGVNASVSGGNTVNGETITGLFNWANGTPAKYKQSTMGWPVIDTTQSILSQTVTGGIGIGTATARDGTALDLLSNTTTANSSIGLPKGTTANRPTNVISGMFRYNTDLNSVEVYNGTSWGSVGGAAVLPYYFGGLTLSNDPGSPNGVFDIGSGAATSDDNADLMTAAAAFTKTTSTWVVGTGNGALDIGSVTTGSWYTDYLIKRPDTAVVDNLLSLSTTAPTMPTSYTEKRRIGSLKTDGSANIIAFTQVNSNYYWATPTLDVTTTGLGTSAALQTLNVPPGVNVTPLCEVSISNALASTTTPVSVYLSSPDETDLATTATSPFSAVPGYSYLAVTTTGTPTNAACPFLTTNTSSQIRARANTAGTTLTIITRGWQD